MELIEIVDIQGKFTGEIIDKEEAHDKNLLHNEISVFILNNNKQILLQKRAATKRFGANKWGLCSGHVDAGETLENAALREMKEEVGLDVSKEDLHSLGEKLFIIGNTNSHITYHFYTKTNKEETEFIIQKEELSQVKWFDIDTIINMINLSDETITLKENRLHLLEQLKEL